MAQSSPGLKSFCVVQEEEKVWDFLEGKIFYGVLVGEMVWGFLGEKIFCGVQEEEKVWDFLGQIS